MKFIHTADWHLGNKMHSVERNEEFNAFLQWLRNEIIKNEAETLIVSGDIYDTSNPPIESRKQYINFLASLSGTCCKNVIVVGGNHDSGALLDSEKEVLDLLNIHVVGSISNRNAKDLVFELFNQKGEVSGICCAVPFARESELRIYCDENNQDGTFSDKAYKSLYEKVLSEAKKARGEKNIPIIATGHLYAANLEGRLSSLQKEEENSDDGVRKIDVVGNLGLVHADIFPEDFDYVALGHIHYTTKVGGNPKIRYSGSPFVLGFDECQIRRNVLLVDANKGKEPDVKSVEIPKFMEYRRITGTSDEITDEIQKYITNAKKKDEDGKLYFHNDEKKTFIEAAYSSEDGMKIHEKLDNLSEKLPEDVKIVSRRVIESSKKQILNLSVNDIRELKNLDSTEIYKALILAKCPEIDSENKEISEEKNKELEKKRQKLFDIYVPMLLEAEKEAVESENQN